jgi:hypothetical protein
MANTCVYTAYKFIFVGALSAVDVTDYLSYDDVSFARAILDWYFATLYG